MVDAAHARTEETVLVQRDWRADGGARRVRVTRADIHIARRFGGVNMRISVPVPAYRGLLLDLATGEDGAPCWRLLLAHRDRDLDVVLAETADETVAAADWAEWASWLGLPRLAAIEAETGAESDAPRLTPAPRRGASAVRRRRPQFLVRRKSGDAARLSAIFAGEREIICYE